jgi:MFS family permease
MDPVSSHRFSVIQISVTLAIGSTALLMLGLQPILLGELVGTQFISSQGVGLVAMGEILALGVGVVLSDALLPISRHKTITVIASLVTAVIAIPALYSSGDNRFALMRAAAGLTEGVMLWSVTSVIVRAANPERLAAIFMAVSTAAQGVVAALLAGLVIPRASWEGGFAVLAALTVLSAVLAAWLPPSLAPLQSHTAEKMRWTVARLLPLVIAFLQMAAVSSLWAYMELLGKAVGLDDTAARFIVPEVIAMQVLGGLAATWAIQQFTVVRTLALGSIVLIAVGGGIHLLPTESATSFTLISAVFGFTWLFLMPFQVALAFRADSKGRVALLIPAAQLIGSAAGPFVASLTMTKDDAQTVPLVSMAFALCAAILVASGWRLWVNADSDKSKAPPSQECPQEAEAISRQSAK